MMDSKLLLIKAVTLLYRESQLEDQTINSRALVQEVVDSFDFKDASAEVASANATQIAIRSTLLYMLEQSSTHTYDKENLLQRIKINSVGDDYLFQVVEDSFNRELDDEATRTYCNNASAELHSYLNKNKIKEVIKTAFRKTSFEEESVDWTTFITDLQSELTPYANGLVNRDIGSMVTSIDISEEDSVEHMLKLGLDSSSNEGIMKLGWQGFNRALNGFEGLRRGDFYLLGALKHNYKSGFLTHIPKQVAIYNKPYMLDDSKKPLIIYISLENNLNDNIIDMYTNLKAHEGIEIDRSKLDIGEATSYLKTRLMERGYYFKMLRFDPTDFTYIDLFQLLDSYIAEGYEIHLVSMDYLNLMSKKGCEGGTGAEQIRDLFRRTRNYCNPKRITFLTAHQFSADAVMLDRQGGDDFVLEVADKSYYDGAKGISQEVDVEIGFHG